MTEEEFYMRLINEFIQEMNGKQFDTPIGRIRWVYSDYEKDGIHRFEFQCVNHEDKCLFGDLWEMDVEAMSLIDDYKSYCRKKVFWKMVEQSQVVRINDVIENYLN